MRAGIALGSNLGDRLENIRQARDRICALDERRQPFLQSPVYETPPLGCEPGARTFYNAVLEIEFAGPADQLLRELQEIERVLGRAPDHARNVSRTIDLDLLYFGGEQRLTGELQLPHPRFAQREFVLRPLADIVPELRLPGQAASVRELLARIPAGDEIRCVTKTW
ncbi:MAG: 2-amino-4-hydroxy-6-hydroxymethyldihydropteridine diphosphokinase [Verrucomicrobia bacterium]|nr:2-amino-4-hydroxy-6-hydroxymethyldihydropteridine diphosphokinase [Verrucomicrobiota bacterium]